MKDNENEELDNTSNEKELVAYNTKNKYMIEKILKRRTRKRKKEVYVSWLHYDDKFNSWIPAKDLEKL